MQSGSFIDDSTTKDDNFPVRILLVCLRLSCIPFSLQKYPNIIRSSWFFRAAGWRIWLPMTRADYRTFWAAWKAARAYGKCHLPKATPKKMPENWRPGTSFATSWKHFSIILINFGDYYIVNKKGKLDDTPILENIDIYWHDSWPLHFTMKTCENHPIAF